jgi:hypothetical protein
MAFAVRSRVIINATQPLRVPTPCARLPWLILSTVRLDLTSLHDLLGSNWVLQTSAYGHQRLPTRPSLIQKGKKSPGALNQAAVPASSRPTLLPAFSL